MMTAARTRTADRLTNSRARDFCNGRFGLSSLSRSNTGASPPSALEKWRVRVFELIDGVLDASVRLGVRSAARADIKVLGRSFGMVLPHVSAAWPIVLCTFSLFFHISKNWFSSRSSQLCVSVLFDCVLCSTASMLRVAAAMAASFHGLAPAATIAAFILIPALIAIVHAPVRPTGKLDQPRHDSNSSPMTWSDSSSLFWFIQVRCLIKMTAFNTAYHIVNISFHKLPVSAGV